MVAGGRVVLRRAKMDDDEYVADEDEEEEEEDDDAEEVEPEPEDESDADLSGEAAEEDEDLEIGAPRRPSRPRGRGRKAGSDDDADFDGAEEESEDEEDLEVETPRPRPRPRRPAKGRRRGPKRKREPDEDSDADFEEELEIDAPRPRARRRARKARKPRDESDADSDGEEGFEIETPTPKRAPRARRRARKPKPRDESDEDEGFEIETPRPKRAPRARRRARKPKPYDESDADSDEDEGFEIETPRPKRAPRARRPARKPKPHDESDTDFGEEDDGLEDEGFEMPRPKRAPRARSTARKAKPHDESDADSDGEEDDGLENEEWEVEAPWPKRPPTLRSRRRREEQEIVQSDADFKGEEEEPEDDELEVETPQPASGGSNVKQEDKFDADFDGDEVFEDQEEDEELEIEVPQSVMFRSGGRNMKQEDELDADFNGADEEVENQGEDEELETPPSVKYRSDGRHLKHEDDLDADFNVAEEEFEDQEEDEELETETLQPTNPSEARVKGRKVKPAGSSRQRHEDDDDYEEEIEDEDEDFEPEVDEEEEDEEEDVEEDDDDLGDYAPTRATKLGPRNHLAKRKPAARRQHRKRKSGSRVSKGKTRNGMSARRRRGKGWVADDHEDDEEEDDDEDFVVSDDVEEEVNYWPRKKAKGGRKTSDGSAEPVPAGEAWPSVESDTSEFEFVTSEEEHAENEAPVAEPAKIKRKKGRRKKGSESDSSSDSDYVISEEELKDLGLPQETVPQLPPHPARRTIVPKSVDGKGKEPEEALKQICGICLSEEQTATIQGVLNCCTHYFCFVCILEWSKVESRCPLCKRRFNTITKSSVADLGLGLRNAPVRVEKRDQVYQPTEDEMRRWLDPYENVVCIECNQGGDDNLMLLCDICDSSAHTFCVGLGREVPEGNWYCGGCRFSVEGPSNAQTQERVVHRAESNMNTADSSSGSFGRSIPSGVFQRPPPINVQPSLQGFDLNLSPIETPEEDKRAESHISAEPVSTPTGRHATLDRRRALNRRIRILLFRPRTATNAWQNSVQHDRSTAAGTEQNQRNTSTSTDLSPSCSRPDFMQSQQSSSHLVQSASNLTQCTDEGGSNFREVENAKDELIPIVKKSIKHICARSPLDQSSFTNVARRATHTILALSGIAHNRDRVVTTPFPFPSHCCHACDGQEPAFLMRTICSSCFNLFVGDVVSHIANMFS